MRNAIDGMPLESRRAPLGDAATRYLGSLFFFAAPLLIAVGALAEQIVAVLLGSGWQGAAPLIAILSFAACARLVTVVIEPYFSLVGRAELIQRFSVISVAANMILLTIAVQFSLLAVAYAELTGAVLSGGLALFLLRASGGLPIRPVMARMTPILLGCAACVIAIAAVKQPPTSDITTTVLHGIAAGSAGIAAFLALYLVADRLLAGRRRTKASH